LLQIPAALYPARGESINTLSSTVMERVCGWTYPAGRR
jgi:hypothetical protein